jgi:hypothetical protein
MGCWKLCILPAVPESPAPISVKVSPIALPVRISSFAGLSMLLWDELFWVGGTPIQARLQQTAG